MKRCILCGNIIYPWQHYIMVLNDNKHMACFDIFTAGYNKGLKDEAARREAKKDFDNLCKCSKPIEEKPVVSKKKPTTKKKVTAKAKKV